jgi:hypothetical protein
MHLNLSAVHSGPQPDRSHAPIAFSTNDKYQDIFAELGPSRSWSTPSPDPPSHLQRDSLHLFQELYLQQLIDKRMDSAIEADSTSTSCVEDGFILQWLLDSLPPLPPFNVTSTSQNITSRQQYAALLRAKYHEYEMSCYWPAIYRAIALDFADPELLAHASLFIESIISFLGTANFAVRLCIPKSWPLAVRYVCAKPQQFPFLRLSSFVNS